MDTVSRQIPVQGPEAAGSSTGITEKLGDAAAAVIDKTQELAGSAVEKVQDFASDVSDKTSQVASRVVHRVQDMGSSVADTFEAGQQYVKEKGVSGMMDDVEDLIREHPLPSLAIGFACGLLLSRVFRD